MFDAEFAPMQVHLHNHLKGLIEDIKDGPITFRKRIAEVDRHGTFGYIET